MRLFNMNFTLKMPLSIYGSESQQTGSINELISHTENNNMPKNQSQALPASTDKPLVWKMQNNLYSCQFTGFIRSSCVRSLTSMLTMTNCLLNSAISVDLANFFFKSQKKDSEQEHMIQCKELNLINCRMKASCNNGCSRLSLSRKQLIV